MSGHAEIEEQIERLRKGNTLPENEVKVLCEKVRKKGTNKQHRMVRQASTSSCLIQVHPWTSLLLSSLESNRLETIQR